MLKEPVVDNVFGHTIPIKNERFLLNVRLRSSMATKHNINVAGHRKATSTLSNQGEIIVTVINTGREVFNLMAGTRFAQAVVHLSNALNKEGFIKYKLLGEEVRAPVMEDCGIFGKMPVFLSMEYCLVPPVSSKIVRTGVAISLPNKSCYMQLQSPPLSSGFYTIENSVHMTSVQAGVIDADYREEVKVMLRNDSKDQIFEIKPGVPVAMGVLYDVACPVTHPTDATGAIENLISIDDERNEIDGVPGRRATVISTRDKEKCWLRSTSALRQRKESL
ncbi:hypothetical protein O3P69_011423 [Scylla paramamosain]|uniref:dUTP diphosphatase n=1 Tax=Scylla paramamosain TaxID=85552 RepID=A0AAW0T910_SCYPA